MSKISRRPSFLKQVDRVYVLCEDSKSSLDYLNKAKLHFRCTPIVEIAHGKHTDPLGIVRDAAKKAANFESIFCVIDRDEHANYEEAVDEAKKTKNLALIPSFPCFEYWLLLHVEYTTRSFCRSGKKSPAQQLIEHLKTKELFCGYEKGDAKEIFEILFRENLIETARLNADRSLRSSREDGRTNPVTYLHTLIDKFEELSSPQRA